jgi:uncharacterized protein YbjT (DUF2867 family)
MSQSPSVAITGAKGYIGKIVVPYLYEALENGRISELRILSRSAPSAPTNSPNGVSEHQVNYSQPETLVKALSGVNVVISMFLFMKCLR